MAERKATNKYYPPEWDPSKGMLNKFHGTHALRERAKKLKSEGILVVRFETPWNMWCLGCKVPIAQGVRYNAEKKKVGNYFSTTIYSFRMKCHQCPNRMVIETDPKNTDFACREGCRKKIEEFSEEDAETMKIKSEEEFIKMDEDPFYKLEHQTEQQQEFNQKNEPEILTKIQQFNSVFKDDWALSQKLRKKFRVNFFSFNFLFFFFCP